MSDTLLFTLLIIALGIILVLSGIAGFYLWKLKQKNAESRQKEEAAKKAWREKKEELAKDIRFIAHALVQGQCEITEGCLRLKILMDHLDVDLQHKPDFQTIQTVYKMTSNMPTHQAYKDLNRKEQFKLDNKRFKIEDDHRDSVINEAKAIMSYRFEILNLH